MVGDTEVKADDVADRREAERRRGVKMMAMTTKMITQSFPV